MPNLRRAVENYFELQTHNATLGREVRAGITTYLTMAYILFVNPDILSNAIVIDGVPVKEQLLTVTALAAAIGCLTMGIVARYPFALAPGMGLNAYFTYSVVLGQGVPWQTALGAVFISGIIFIVMSVVGVREIIVNAIPRPIKDATTVGIGLFLAFIGCQGMHLVVAHPQTLVTLGDLSTPTVLLGLFGLLATASLLARRVRGAILIAIALTSFLAIVTEAPVYGGMPFAGLTQDILRAPTWPTDIFLQLNIGGAMELGILGIVFIFLFVDFFDTAGTLFGLANRCGFTKEDGTLPRASRAFVADAVATTAGALLGTSSTTSYVESASGIEDGGRTGLTAVTVGLCFFASIFVASLTNLVPTVATAPTLIIIGAMMMASVTKVQWSDYRIAVPAFLTIIGMPLTYSIANGISFGIIAYTLLHGVTGEFRRLHPLMIVLTCLLIARYLYVPG